MKEKELIQIITKTLDSKYIGDDCAYLKDLGITISQDSLVEDVHFKLSYMTPFQLGYKAVMVNISDICASGAEPKYLTISLSLPKDTQNSFVKDFYEGAKFAANGVEIVGGDITGGDKVFISITAIGSSKNRKISSRKNAQAGQKIIVSGPHGSSAAGLKLLLDNQHTPQTLINAHLMPKAQVEFSKKIATAATSDYAMMDSSDGLMDALSQIAQASNVKMSIDFSKIPFDKEIKIFNNWQDLVFYGGEDYQIIATIEEGLLKKLHGYTIIGEVEKAEKDFGVEVNYENHKEFYTPKQIDEKLYNHF